MEKLTLVSRYALGDAVVMTALLRDIQLSYPNTYQVFPVTGADAVWRGCQHCSKFRPSEGRVIRLSYASQLNQSIHAPMHFIEGYIRAFNEATGLRVAMTTKKPCMRLVDNEGPIDGLGDKYWVMMAGWKNDMATKKWSSGGYLEVARRLAGVVKLVRAGSLSHNHHDIDGLDDYVVDMRGKTDIRGLIRLIAHSSGVICPITAAMHIAAAFDKPAVVIAGGREPSWWEKYDTHTWLGENRPCGIENACLCGGLMTGKRPCRHTIEAENGLIAKCMAEITPEMVSNAVLGYVANEP
ncbi:MAG: glycosyltransferase family 9 protein [Candidatus Omnitrophota bacterium]